MTQAGIVSFLDWNREESIIGGLTGSYAVFLADFEPSKHIVVGHSGVQQAVVYHLGEVVEIDAQRCWSCARCHNDQIQLLFLIDKEVLLMDESGIGENFFGIAPLMTCSSSLKEGHLAV